MGVGDQVRSFVEWLLSLGDGPHRLSDKRVLSNYTRWAEEWDVVPVPPSIILAALKRHPQVRHSRDRILDASGKAVRNANNTPMRGSFYTFATKRPDAKLPGKVPVQTGLEIVAQQPLNARPVAKAVKPAAAPAVEQPRRRAA